MDRRGILLTLAVTAVIGALVAFVSSGRTPRGTAVLDESPTPTPGASAMRADEPENEGAERGTPAPTQGTAGSTRLYENFDAAPTGSEVEGWRVTAGASLRVAAVPTAVDRSARLSADDSGTACRPVSQRLARLAADFMIDRLTDAPVTVLSLRWADKSTMSLTVSGEAVTMDGSPQFAIEPGTWYRWSISTDDRQHRLSLSRSGGEALGNGAARAPQAPLEEFCLSSQAPARIFLSTLTVEGN